MLKKAHVRMLNAMFALPSMPHSELPSAVDASYHTVSSQIADAYLDAVVTIDSLGMVTIWNQAAEHMFGYCAVDVLGAPLTQFLPEYSNVLDAIETIGSGSKWRVFETKHRRKNGQLVYVSSRITPIRDADGKIVGVSVVLRDTTHQKNLERSALHNEQSLRLTLKASRMGVWFWQVSQDTISWDPQTVLLLTGVDSGSLKLSYEEFAKCIHPDDLESAQLVIQKGLDTHTDIYVELRVIWPDGSIHAIASTGVFLLNEETDSIEYTGVCADITQARLDGEQAKRLAILEQREEFMTTLTHDLKNPLLGSNYVLEILASREIGTVFPKEAQLLLSVRDSNKRLIASLQNLIDVYRTEMDTVPRPVSQLALAGLVHSCISEVSTVAAGKNIRIKTELPDGEIDVVANCDDIRRVVENLLGNALKFTSEGDVITITMRKLEESVSVEIADTGPGVSETDQKHLFERFSQGGVGKKYSSGSGLGLYLCKRIIDAHKGTIECRSVEGMGTTFEFTLPDGRL